MARYSAAKIIVRYHIGEPNEVTSDLAAFAYFNDNSASDPATFAEVAFGRSGGGDSDDRLQIALMAQDQNISFAYLNRLRPKVRALLRRHWRKIEQVAQALLRAKTLTAVEIDALIEQVTQQNEREVAAPIKLARKPLRDEYARVHGISLLDQAK
jgi:hypothetical protein